MKDRVFRGSGMDRREKTLGDPQISSKEDYIARLEAELRSLRGDTSNGSSSRALLVPDVVLQERWHYHGESITVRKKKEEENPTS